VNVAHLKQLFVVFPLMAKKGVMGVPLGSLTPLFVLLFNDVWGLKAAAILKRVRGVQGHGSS
jgi:hypothetical protein